MDTQTLAQLVELQDQKHEAGHHRLRVDLRELAAEVGTEHEALLYDLRRLQREVRLDVRDREVLGRRVDVMFAVTVYASAAVLGMLLTLAWLVLR